ATGSFTVTVTDGENPVLSGLPSDITQPTDAGLATAVVTWTEPTASDNAPGVTLTSTHTPGDAFPLGETTVTYTATDAAGNTATGSFKVTVTDGENPVLSGLPTDITQPTDAGLATAVVTWTEPTANDNAPGVTLTSTHTPGDAFPIGETTVTYTATDAAGNTATGSFTVTVTDGENPVLSGLPTDITQPTDAGLATAVVTWTEPTASDNAPGVTLTSTHNPGDAFPIGETTVTYTATDAAGNTATGSFKVTVTDGEAPVFVTFPANIAVEIDYPNSDAVVSWTAPTASDNVPSVAVVQTAGPASGSRFPLGVTNVSYKATDGAGNEVTRSFTVTVTQTPPGSVTFEIASPAGGMFTFASQEPALNFSVDVSGGSGRSNAIYIRPGSYPVTFAVPSGFGVADASCTGTSTIDPATKTGEIHLVSGGAVTCTISALDALGTTAGMIGSFIEARGQMILQNQPQLTRRLERLTGQYTNPGGATAFGMGFKSPNLPFSMMVDKNEASFSYSLRRSNAKGGAPQIVGNPVEALASAMNAPFRNGRQKGEPGYVGSPELEAINATPKNNATEPLAYAPDPDSIETIPEQASESSSDDFDPMAHRFDIWAEGTYSRFNAAGGSGDFVIAHLGADYLFTSNLLIGLGAQLDWTRMDQVGGGDISGYGFMVGPYLTVRLQDHLYLDARAAWGRSWNDVSPFGTYRDSFDATRWLVTGALIGDFDVGAFNIKPEARLSWFSEQTESYVDKLNVTIPSFTVSTGTFEFGPTISTKKVLENDMVFSPYLNFKGIWTFDQTNTATGFTAQPGLAEEGIRGRAEVGFGLADDAGFSTNLSAFYDGIGEKDFEAWGLTLSLKKKF
ncbi:hypothetical protein CSC94_22470, partial [Zhengella mangrovi]